MKLIRSWTFDDDYQQ